MPTEQSVIVLTAHNVEYLLSIHREDPQRIIRKLRNEGYDHDFIYFLLRTRQRIIDGEIGIRVAGLGDLESDGLCCHCTAAKRIYDCLSPSEKPRCIDHDTAVCNALMISPGSLYSFTEILGRRHCQ